jgi:predicted cupin superfamily sugar epimerase
VHHRVDELIEKLELRPHPEGGFYREIFRSARNVTPDDGRPQRPALTTIYFLLPVEAVSRWHKVESDEVWHLYEGGPLELLEMDPQATTVVRHRLGAAGEEGQSPVVTIKAGNWQAARSVSDYTLLGCTVGPGFDFTDFALLAEDPDLADQVLTLVPEETFLV